MDKMQNKKNMANRVHGEEELDPQIWKELPNELMEKVISELPFASLVAFRPVCKLWRFEIIPRIALEMGASGSSAILYFSPHIKKPDLGPWWCHFRKSESDSGGAFQEFISKSFPRPQSNEFVELMNSTCGLLFFAFVKKSTLTTTKLVACNPLTALCKVLMLPCRLQWNPSIVGVDFDAKKQHYRLVAAGTYKKLKVRKFLYESKTSTWTEEVSLGTAKETLVSRRYRIFPDNVVRSAINVFNGDFSNHVDLYWSTMNLFSDRDTFQQIQSASITAFERENPDIKLFCHRSALECDNPSCKYYYDYYISFRQDTCMYLVLFVRGEENVSIKIIAQNPEDNSYSEFPVVSWDGFTTIGGGSEWHFWSFTSSLTSVP